jgi:hypothetical protein
MKERKREREKERKREREKERKREREKERKRENIYKGYFSLRHDIQHKDTLKNNL